MCISQLHCALWHAQQELVHLNFCEVCVLSQLQLPSSAQLILLHLNLVTDCVLFPAYTVHCGTPSWFAVHPNFWEDCVHFPAAAALWRQLECCAPILFLCTQTLWADCVHF